MGPLVIHELANVEAKTNIGADVKIWAHAHIRSGASLGKNTIVGEGAYVGSGVSVGENSKIQNYALIYEPAKLGNGVFIGPGAVLTNDQFPRAVSPDGTQKSGDDWDPVGVTIETGASVGAGAICVAPVTIGAWAMIGAGAVVVNDVAPYALVVGSPAKQIGWVGEAGIPLVVGSDGKFQCPSTGDTFELVSGKLIRA